jgi:hypothetical protein
MEAVGNVTEGIVECSKIDKKNNTIRNISLEPKMAVECRKTG